MQASIPNNINMLANAFQNGYHVISHYIWANKLGLNWLQGVHTKLCLGC